MEVTAVPVRAVPITSADVNVATTVAKAEATEKASDVRRIDFSHVTPRELNAYLDEMIFRDQIDPMDATVLLGAFSSEQYERYPDTPVNLKSEIDGTMKFHANRGDVLMANWYSGLLERIESMEKQSVHISVYA
jgi:hypothetical protein